MLSLDEWLKKQSAVREEYFSCEAWERKCITNEWMKHKSRGEWESEPSRQQQLGDDFSLIFYSTHGISTPVVQMANCKILNSSFSHQTMRWNANFYFLLILTCYCVLYECHEIILVLEHFLHMKYHIMNSKALLFQQHARISAQPFNLKTFQEKKIVFSFFSSLYFCEYLVLSEYIVISSIIFYFLNFFGSFSPCWLKVYF